MPEKYIYRSKSQMKEYYQQFLSLFSDVALENGFIKKGRGFYRVYGDNMLQFVRLNRNRGMMPSEIMIECDARWLFDLPLYGALMHKKYEQKLIYSYAPGELYGASESKRRHTLETLIHYGTPDATPFPENKRYWNWMYFEFSLETQPEDLGQYLQDACNAFKIKALPLLNSITNLDEYYKTIDLSRKFKAMDNMEDYNDFADRKFLPLYDYITGRTEPAMRVLNKAFEIGKEHINWLSGTRNIAGWILDHDHSMDSIIEKDAIAEARDQLTSLSPKLVEQADWHVFNDSLRIEEETEETKLLRESLQKKILEYDCIIAQREQEEQRKFEESKPKREMLLRQLEQKAAERKAKLFDAEGKNSAIEKLKKLGFDVSEKDIPINDKLIELLRRMIQKEPDVDNIPFGYYLMAFDDDRQMMFNILYEKGSGIESDTDGNWKPSWDQLYAFDYRPAFINTMYTNFLLGVDAIVPDIRIDCIQDSGQCADSHDQAPEGNRIVSFNCNGHPYKITLEDVLGQMDMSILAFMKKVMRKEGCEKQLYNVAGTGYDSILLIYSTKQEASKIEKALSRK